jgi:hypothetical protein
MDMLLKYSKVSFLVNSHWKQAFQTEKNTIIVIHSLIRQVSIKYLLHTMYYVRCGDKRNIVLLWKTQQTQEN